MDRICIGHSADTTDIGYLERCSIPASSCRWTGTQLRSLTGGSETRR